MAGAHPNRSWPDFFSQGFDVPVTSLASPGFVYRRQRRVNLPATLWQLISRAGAHRASLRTVETVIEQTKPDLLFNFLEPIVGWYSRRRSQTVPILAVGHQYMLEHPSYPRLDSMRLAQWGLRRYVRAAGRSTLRYALSFYDAPAPEGAGMIIAPPLLRDDLLRLDGRADEGHGLVYLLNAGYLPELLSWQARHPAEVLHVFCDRVGAPAEEHLGNGLIVHRLDAAKFLRLMATARSVVCSAGFESLSEAAWLRKPSLAVPVEGHIEQMLNAHDLQLCGLGVAATRFDLDRLQNFKAGAAHRRFADWVRRSDDKLDEAVFQACAQRARNENPEPRLPVKPVWADSRVSH
jgi:uncharacterized protein (TIGR00661 family)